MWEEEPVPIVIDNGSSSCKAGFADGQGDFPCSHFSTVIGRPPATSLNQSEYIGDDVFAKKHYLLSKSYPIKNGVIDKWDDMEKIWNHIFYQELRVAPEEYSVLLSESPFNPRENREKTTEIMFEKFKVASMYLANSGSLAMCATGRTSGLVLSCGAQVSYALPIYQFAIKQAARQLDYGGDTLTRYLTDLLNSEHKYSFATTYEQRIVEDMKRNLCYVSCDYLRDVNNATHKDDKQYVLPSGTAYDIAAKLTFQCPEALFRPSLLGLEASGVHEAVYNSIMQCDEAIREELKGNIVISGGSTLFSGFTGRIMKELNAITPSFVLGNNNAGLDDIAVWAGGARLASCSIFQRMVISKSEYDETGPNIVNMKCF